MIGQAVHAWVLFVDDLELINLIAAAGDCASVWELAVSKFASLGLSRANYGYTHFRSETTYGDPEDALFLSSAGPEFEKHYFHNNFFLRSPLFRWSMANEGACTWAWVREAGRTGKLTADEESAVRQNMALGVTSGITISFPVTSAREKGVLGLMADPGLDDAAVENIYSIHIKGLMAVANVMHLKLTKLPVLRRRVLTRRQREALEWVAEGKTMQDVAQIMDVTTAMIEKHLRLARQALGVDTTTQAVAKAAMLNLIFQLVPDQQVWNSRLP